MHKYIIMKEVKKYTRSKLSEWANDFGLCQATLLSNSATSQSARPKIWVQRKCDDRATKYKRMNWKIQEKTYLSSPCLTSDDK